MAGSVSRGSVQTMLFKKSSTDTVMETVKMEANFSKSPTKQLNEGGGVSSFHCTSWFPHEKTGIYYPKGQEKVMDNVPSGAAKDFGINWRFNEDHATIH